MTKINKGVNALGREVSWAYFIPAVNGWAMDERLGHGNLRSKNSD